MYPAAASNHSGLKEDCRAVRWVAVQPDRLDGHRSATTVHNDLVLEGAIAPNFDGLAIHHHATLRMRLTSNDNLGAESRSGGGRRKAE